jgi:hypothetical protein
LALFPRKRGERSRWKKATVPAVYEKRDREKEREREREREPAEEERDEKTEKVAF